MYYSCARINNYSFLFFFTTTFERSDYRRITVLAAGMGSSVQMNRANTLYILIQSCIQCILFTLVANRISSGILAACTAEDQFHTYYHHYCQLDVIKTTIITRYTRNRRAGDTRESIGERIWFFFFFCLLAIRLKSWSHWYHITIRTYKHILLLLLSSSSSRRWSSW